MTAPSTPQNQPTTCIHMQHTRARKHTQVTQLWLCDHFVFGLMILIWWLTHWFIWCPPILPPPSPQWHTHRYNKGVPRQGPSPESFWFKTVALSKSDTQSTPTFNWLRLFIHFRACNERACFSMNGRFYVASHASKNYCSCSAYTVSMEHKKKLAFL